MHCFYLCLSLHLSVYTSKGRGATFRRAHLGAHPHPDELDLIGHPHGFGLPATPGDRPL